MSESLQPIAPETPGVIAAIDTPGLGGEILTVGVGQEFASLSDAIAAVHDNDVIAIKAGTYVDDTNSRQNGYVNAKNVTIEGVGGMAHIEEAPGAQPYNQKAPIVAVDGLTVKNLEISGVTARNLNGAGIRVDSGNLTVENSYFHDDQDGILGGGAGSSIVIDHSEFAYNGGGGGGSAHNVYVGSIYGAPTASLVFTNNFTHDSYTGHLLKTRAQNNIIENNVIADNQGTGSYDIDIPNGGVATVQNNLIEKGPNTVNTTSVHYGGENQFSYPVNTLDFSNNTLLYDNGIPSYPVGVANQIDVTTGLPATPVTISSNQFYNLPDQYVLNGAGTVSGSVDLATEPAVPTSHPWANAPVIQAPTGPLTLVLDSPVGAAHGVSGGATGATITDDTGNVIDSGPVGITLTENGNAIITTDAGSQNTITLNHSSAVVSAGADTITANAVYSNIAMSGRSTLNVSGSGWGTFTLDGQETVNTAAGGIWNIGSGADATINATNDGNDIAKPDGATVAYNVDYIQWGYHFTASVTASGGASDIYWSNRLLTLTATDTAADTFTYRGGNAVFVGGSGADTYDLQPASTPGGNLEIKGFKVGIDTLSYAGWTGDPVKNASVTSGNTVLDLTDGTHIQIDGVDLTAAQYDPPPPATISSPSTPTTSLPDTLTLNLSEDAYQGDAQFTVSVDGTQLSATPQTVTALHDAGQTQAFTYAGNFGTGPHNVAVAFTNDAYGGSPSLDRNLYVNSVALDGNAPTAESATYSSGTYNESGSI